MDIDDLLRKCVKFCRIVKHFAYVSFFAVYNICLYILKANDGQTDLIGLMIEASAGKHVADQTSELITDILKEDDSPSQVVNSSEARKNTKLSENVTIKHKSQKYLLSGTTFRVMA